MNTGKMILGALAGLATGAIVGILLAPKSGADTRKKIIQEGNSLAESIDDRFEDFLDSAKAHKNNAEKVVDSLVLNGKSKFEEAKSSIKKSV